MTSGTIHQYLIPSLKQIPVTPSDDNEHCSGFYDFADNISRRQL